MHTAQGLTVASAVHDTQTPCIPENVSSPAVTTNSQAERKGKAEIAGSEPAAV